MDPKELLRITLLEFSIHKNEISVFTVKTNPYFNEELHRFNSISPRNATIFKELYNKLKTDGCRFKDVSETNFSVII